MTTHTIRGMAFAAILVAGTFGCSDSDDSCSDAAREWQRAQEDSMDVIDGLFARDESRARSALDQLEEQLDDAFAASEGCSAVEQ